MGVRRRNRGSLIIAALLLFVLLLAMGLGLMSSQSGRMRAARAQAEAIQAKSLALAAWADVKTKLGKDLFFPPNNDAQGHFSYSEDVYYDEAGTRVFHGSYTVMIDMKYTRFQRDTGTNFAVGALTDIPLGFYLITCVGKVGPRGAPPAAERVFQFELDPQTFRVIRMHDLQSL
jgi:hypothetical protein